MIDLQSFKKEVKIINSGTYSLRQRQEKSISGEAARSLDQLALT